MSALRRLTVLVNPTAGGGRAIRALPAVEAALAGRRLDVRVWPTDSHEHAVALARQAALDGGAVVAFGGDGMARVVAGAVRGTDASLGILPGGRGNDFARALGLPLDPVAACGPLIEGRARAIDAGDVNGETFIGIASIGIESEVTAAANRAPRFLGQASYLYATLAGISRWRAARFDLVLDGGEQQTFTGYIAAVSNSGRFGGGMRMAPRAQLDDGLLDVVVIEDGPRWKFVADTPKVFKGTHVSDPSVHLFTAREVQMRADRDFEVYADGDPIATTPARVTVDPGALRVLAPTAG